MNRLARPLSLKPYEPDRRQIKTELGATAVELCFLEDDYDPDALAIMAQFKVGSVYHRFAHTEKFPLRPNWMARAVANLRFSRERA